MATKQIGTLAVGSIVKLKFDGELKEFIIVHQGLPGNMYDSSCNGTWMLMKELYTYEQWSSSNLNDYAQSDIHKYLNRDVWLRFDIDIKKWVKEVKIPYVGISQNKNSIITGGNGLACNLFLLSGYEVGFTKSNFKDGDVLSYFEECPNDKGCAERIAYVNGINANHWWLRTAYGFGSLNNVIVTILNGDENGVLCNQRRYVRPTLIFNPNTPVETLSNGSLVINTAPTTPASITIPPSINGGSTITISWGASSDAEGNLEGYKLERSTNGGTTWFQVYQGSARQTTNTVAFGTESVMYRVRAYDSEGLHSGYRTSAQVTVLNNHAPGAPAGITVPEEVKGGGTLAVTWQAATDPDGDALTYSLERQHDGGAWSVIHSGAELSFEDSVTKGWQTVRYRVRAKDVHDACGPYTTSDTREVDNNTAPAITCALSGDLGTRTEGFAVSYTVADPDEGDTVTVTEALDGKTVRTLQGTGEQSFALTGEAWMKVLNGRRTMAITASDGKVEATHTLTFTKAVTKAAVTLTEPMEADDKITLCVLSVTGAIPKDAKMKMEVTNNGLDDEPVWQDCTAAVQAGANILLENETAQNGFAFNFRLALERGPSGQGGYITSIQGGFQ